MDFLDDEEIALLSNERNDWDRKRRHCDDSSGSLMKCSGKSSDKIKVLSFLLFFSLSLLAVLVNQSSKAFSNKSVSTSEYHLDNMVQQQPSLGTGGDDGDEVTVLKNPAPFSMTLTALNAYGSEQANDHGSHYLWLANKVVVEPHRASTLVAALDANYEGAQVEWTIIDPNGYVVFLQGLVVSHMFTHIGAYHIEATAKSYSADDTSSGLIENKKHVGTSVSHQNESSSSSNTESENSGGDGLVLGTAKLEAHCLYVKREVRSLSEEDRDAFLDAMVVMWNVDTKSGREIYGPTFTGMDRFVSVHANEATGDVLCDRWHEGSGFLTHHLALSLSFEMSLQTVNPAVTTPYWDFTIDGEEIYRAGLGPKVLGERSPMFTESWFGRSDEFSHVVDGRWAHAKATLSVPGKSVGNSFGVLRAPWNNNKDLELTRHLSDICGLEPVNKPIPTCATHFKVLNVTSLAQFQVEIAGYGHGPMHVNTGGVYGQCTQALERLYEEYEDEMKQELTMKEINEATKRKTGVNMGWESDTKFSFKTMIQKYIHLEYFHIYRMLWRSQTCALDGQPFGLTCPEHCDENMTEKECACTCKGITPDGDVHFDWKNFEPCLYSSDTSRTIFSTVVSEELRKDIVTTMCSTPVKEGEQLESASPSDPLFWMIHPVLDRLITAKRLTQVVHSPESSEQELSLPNIKFGDYGKVSKFEDEAWLDYSHYNTDTYHCDGHEPFDAVLSDLPLPELLMDYGDLNHDGAMSNLEFFLATDPTLAEGTTYIYDHFNWDHCRQGSGSPTDNDIDAESLESSSTVFATGYDGDEEKTEREIFTFFGGVTPTEWTDEEVYYKDLKPASFSEFDQITTLKATASEHKTLVSSNRIDHQPME